MKLDARFFSSDPGSGSHNMAVDEAFGACMEGGPPIIRFYSFSPPTLSVGRFQPAREIFNFERIQSEGLDFVRRPTGGQAVLHDQELTYSVILSKYHISPFRKRAIYRFISKILIQGLDNLGIAADFSRDRFGDSHNPDCFATTGQFEIITSKGAKIIGSAQSVSRSYCLQHGSIPLKNSQKKLSSLFLNPPLYGNREATSIDDELNHAVSQEDVRMAFVKAFERAFNLVESEMTNREKSEAEEMIQKKYTDKAWNLKF